MRTFVISKQDWNEGRFNCGGIKTTMFVIPLMKSYLALNRFVFWLRHNG
ncbi:hypothetical protein [Psychrosphaera algicola]|uniref:Uncharacterized protein n=1 Tax=Psychrosphaera algicola TaxID=3023714 RepID=A0ABT5FGM8_9GAMM|nr:hypothetical protein [Psychrosphaera sp. G1-22]MDC2889956.1 hypothetical protein [Psychrosphaera sp. G1-22]